MSRRYAIWNKTDDIFTPVGEKFTAEQWKERYPIAEIPTIKVVCGGGILNGSFFGILQEMIDMYESYGCDFSNCIEDDDYLLVIEEWENERSKPKEGYVTNEELSATSLASIAASLEYQNMLTLDDVEPTV